MSAVSTRWRRVGELVLGTGIVQGSNVLTVILLARLLTPVEYGSYRQLFLLNQIFWAIAFSAIPTALTYFGARAVRSADRAAIVRMHLLLTASVAVVPTVVLLAAAELLAELLNNEALPELLRLYAPYPAAYMLQSLVATAMVVQRRTADLPAYMSVIALTTSVPVVAAAYWSTDLAVVVMTASSAASLCATGAVVAILKLSRDAGPAEVGFGNILVYVIPLLLAAGVSIVGLKLDQVAVSRLLGAAMFAIYAVGAFELPLYSLVKSAATAAIMPEITAAAQRRDWSAVLSIWQDLLRKNAAVVLPVSAVLVVFANEFVTVLFGERYAASAPILALFSLLGPIRAVTFGLILRAFGHTWSDLAGAVFFLAVISIAIAPAIKLAGMVGAAVTVVTGTFFVAILLLIMTARISAGRVRVWQLYPPRYLVGYAGLIAIFALLRTLLMFAGCREVSQVALAVLGAILATILLLPEARRRFIGILR